MVEVSIGKYGRMTSGASVIPTNTLADAQSDSAPDTSITQTITRAINRTSHWRIPAWNNMAVSEETKMIVGNTENATKC